MKNKDLILLFLLFSFLSATAQHPRAVSNYPEPYEGNYLAEGFLFATGEKLDTLRLHYYTIGTPQKDKNGKVKNAVLLLHGTGSSGRGFLSDGFAGLLFGPGQLLDASRYFIIIPDGIGHGKSSRPSDGMRMHFPQYNYDDMIKAQHLLLTAHLGVDHLRLILGTSMGAMHAWVWGYTYPGFTDALMPLASLPTAIAGRNRMMRKMAIDLIKMDPAWNKGDYTSPPILGLTGASSSLFFMNSSPYHLQQEAPTREKADAMVEKRRKENGNLDANDLIYALDASRDYDPSPYLSKITATVYAVNSADDEINPPELGIMEEQIKKVAKGRYILLPTSPQTAGHGTNSMPSVWNGYLKELLEKTEE